MRHFNSRDEYHAAIGALLDGTDPIVQDDEYARGIVKERPIDTDLLGDLAGRTIVAWRGESGLHTFEMTFPDFEIGWSPGSIIEHSPTHPRDVCPDRDVSISSAAYHVLQADLEHAVANRGDDADGGSDIVK